MIPENESLDKIEQAHQLSLNAPLKLYIPSLHNLIDAITNEESVNKYLLEKEANKINNLKKATEKLFKRLEFQYGLIENYCHKQLINSPLQPPMNLPLLPLGPGEFRDYATKQMTALNMIHLLQTFAHKLQYLLSVESGKIKPEQQELINEISSILKQPRSTSDQTLSLISLSLKGFVHKHKILHALLIKEVEKFENFTAKKQKSKSRKRIFQFATLKIILIILKQTTFNAGHHLSFVQNFAEVNKNTGEVIQLKQTEELIEWETTFQKMENAITPASPLYSWNLIKITCDHFPSDNDFFYEWIPQKDYIKIQELKRGAYDKYVEDLKWHQSNLLLFIKQSKYNPSNTKKPTNISNVTNNEPYITVETYKKGIYLNKKSKFRLISTKTKRKSLEFKLLILLWKQPNGASRKDQETLGKPKQISKAYRSIVKKLKEELVLNEDYIIRDTTTGRLRINEKYPTDTSLITALIGNEK